MSDHTTRFCLTCKSPLARHQGESPVDWQKRKYCSKDCYLRMCEEKSRREGYPRPCAQCGTQIDRRTYCSWSCAREARIHLPHGQHIPNGQKWCSKCNNSLPITSFSRRKGRTVGLYSHCRSCDRRHKETRKRLYPEKERKQREEANRRRSLSYARYIRVLYRNAKIRAGKRNLVFDLTYEGIIDLYESQSGRCVYSGVEMTFIAGQGRVPTNISMDRKDSKQGYTKENTVLCCFWINVAKASGRVGDILTWAERIKRYNASPLFTSQIEIQAGRTKRKSR